MVALFMPRVRKEHEHLIEGRIRNPGAQHFDGVVADDTQVTERRLIGAQEQSADARSMHLDAQIIVIGIVLRQAPNHFTDPETDLETAPRLASEDGVQVQGRTVKFHAVGRP